MAEWRGDKEGPADPVDGLGSMNIAIFYFVTLCGEMDRCGSEL